MSTTTSKRERQHQRRAERRAAERAAAARRRRLRQVRLAVFGVLGAGLLVALAFWLTGSVDRSLGVPPPEVAADATPVPPPPVSGADPAVGVAAPVVDGFTPDGEPLRIGDGDGPQLLAFMAHWCPHCQRDVPAAVDWVEAGGLPDGVRLVAVSTLHDPARPNWPPDEWLAREGWPGPVLVDSTDAVAEAYGLAGTPYWVLLDADGRVVARASGELGAEGLDALVAQLGG